MSNDFFFRFIREVNPMRFEEAVGSFIDELNDLDTKVEIISTNHTTSVDERGVIYTFLFVGREIHNE